MAVKEAVLPFSRFPDVDPALGPEMRSTGEVMGIDTTFGRAFHKAELAAGTVLEPGGTVFLSLADHDKPAGLVVAKRLRQLGMGIVATKGTADYLAGFGEPVDAVVAKVSEVSAGGEEKTAVDLIASGAGRPSWSTRRRGAAAESDGEEIRKAAVVHSVACVTTISAALAAVQGLLEQRGQPLSVRSLQELHAMSAEHLVMRATSASRGAASSGLRGRGTQDGPSSLIAGTDRVGDPEEPGDDGVGDRGIRDRTGRVVRSRRARCGRRQVAGRLRVGRKPGASPAPDAAGMLNSVGLQGPGLPHWLADVLPGLLRTGATVVASIWGRTVEEFRAAAELLAAAPDGVVAVEINLSCPNVNPGHRPDPGTVRGSSPTTRRFPPK